MFQLAACWKSYGIFRFIFVFLFSVELKFQTKWEKLDFSKEFVIGIPLRSLVSSRSQQKKKKIIITRKIGKMHPSFFEFQIVRKQHLIRKNFFIWNLFRTIPQIFLSASSTRCRKSRTCTFLKRWQHLLGNSVLIFHWRMKGIMTFSILFEMVQKFCIKTTTHCLENV